MPASSSGGRCAAGRCSIPARRRGGRPRGRDGRRRCRSDRLPRGQRCRRRWRLGGGATSLLERSVEIDPWHPAGPKSLAVAAERAGRVDLGRVRGRVRRRARSTTPATRRRGSTWRSCARRTGDVACQARRGRASRRHGRLLRGRAPQCRHQLRGASAMADEADAAYRRSLLSQRLTAFALDWPRDLSDRRRDPGGRLRRAPRVQPAPGLVGDGRADRRRLDRRSGDASPRPRHASASGARRRSGWSARIDTAPDSIVTWDVAIVLRDHWGLPIEDELAIAEVVRGGPFPDRDAPVSVPSPDVRHRDVPDLSGRWIRQRGAAARAPARRTPGSSSETLP